MTATIWRLIGLALLTVLALSACAQSTRPGPSVPTAAPEPPPTRVEVTTEAGPPSKTVEAPPPPPVLSIGPAPQAESSPLPPPPPPAPSPPPRAPAPPARGRQVVLNFDNADVEVVIQAAADIVRFNYILGPNVRGRKVTLQTIGKIGTDEVFPLLLTILDVNGLAAVKSGSVYRIITREGAPQSPLRTIVGREAAAGPSADEVVTQIVPLQFLDAAEAMNLIRPFVAQDGGLGAHQGTNLLIITDTAANVRRLLDILKSVDVADSHDEPQIIPLKHADAQELAPVLLQLFASGRLRTGGVPGGFGIPGPSPAPGAPPRAPVAPFEVGGASDRPPLVVADRRSNSLLVNARKPELETIRRLVAKLDMNVNGGQRVFVYFAENTKARDLAATLDAIYGPGDRTPGSATPGARAPVPIQPVAAPRPSGAGPSGVTVEGVPPQAEIRIVADEIANAIVVTTYPRLWKEIGETIKLLDRMPRQVLIEVLAAEVALNDNTKLGIEWAVRSGNFDAISSPSGNLPGRPPRSLIPLGGLVPPGLSLFAFATDKFLAALNALASENKVNVLSNPSIMTTENKKAVINVSTSVPIVTSQQVPVATGGTTGNSITQTVEYKDVGVILTVTPRIGEQGTVALDVRQEVNQVGATEPPPINSPRFSKREAETSVVLLSNQTLILGGLIQTRRTNTRIGIPGLSRIPILGLLFGSQEELIEKTELVLVITPRVVGTALEAARITEEMRRATPELEESIRRAPRPPAPAPR
ncbi:MAG TPA: type II secretion system secretin GspD [Candidatus Nitrosotalea sp.]|nr:type II secretion system secretin GspD [Candidatus Nitrosotalea sp.]